MIYRLISPEWLREKTPGVPKVIEGELTDEQLRAYNEQGFNCYYLPNHPSVNPGTTVDGSHIDVFNYVFVDCDLKDGVYTKDSFCSALVSVPLPTMVVDSGNGIHAYWAVTDLDSKSYLRLQRRLTRRLKTDEAVGKIYQLMRVPGTYNTKAEGEFKLCEVIFTSEASYTCEQLSKALPQISQADEEYCQGHYDQTYNLKQAVRVDEKLPLKFGKLLRSSPEVKELYAGDTGDRSRADYRLAHIMFAEGFTRAEAMSVLVNCRKALERSPTHRINYADNIAEKVWGFEAAADKDTVALSSSVRDILKRGDAIQGTRFPCWKVYDGTDKGFRLTQVLGLIGGAGSGKTTLALNYFYWFTKNNPDFHHLFVSLEQPEEEIAARWARIADGNEALHDRVQVLSNYNADGSYRNLSLSEIEGYLVKFQEEKKIKFGCVVIDHIGVLKKKSKEGENQGLIDICHNMKAFAKRTNTFLVMQSQTSREKAGIGDLELDKDAAYGTSMFEWYCDYIVTTWQPLKRIYDQAPHMTCSAFKYCKIRHKRVGKDFTKEDVVHALMYDPETEMLTEMTQTNETAYEHWNKIATTLRNKDRKREPSKIVRIEWNKEESNGTTADNSQDE